MAKEIKLTQESLDAYKDELEYLKTTRADEVAEQLKEARSFGDLSENAEYDEAKNEQGKLYSRIAELALRNRSRLPYGGCARAPAWCSTHFPVSVRSFPSATGR